MRRSEVRARQVTVLALAVAGLASADCYRYAPVSVQAIAPSEAVRLRVTESAAARVAGELGTFSTEVDGQLAPEGADSLAVSVPIDRSYRGTTVGTTTQTIVLARSEVVDMRRREFSRSRTILASAGAVVGFGALAVGIVQLVDPNGPPDNQTTPPPPPNLRRPRVVWGRLAVRIRIP
jgi:hypothetical protein